MAGFRWFQIVSRFGKYATRMLLYKAGDQEVENSFMITRIFLKSFGVVQLPLHLFFINNKKFKQSSQ